MNKQFCRIIIGLGVFMMVFLGYGQSAQHSRPSTDVVEGQLNNGLKYYFKHLPNARNKIHMRLLVKAGVEQEQEGQVELAHLLEHVAFGPSPHFPKGIMHPESMRSLGMVRGDINGGTGMKSTSYYLRVPKEHPEAVEKALHWLRDVAADVKFNAREVEKEKASVKQEMLFRESDEPLILAAVETLEAKIYPCTRFTDKILEGIEALTPQELEHFYKKWYRPDRMAIIIVGDLNEIENLEQHIQELFGDIPSAQQMEKPINCEEVYQRKPPQFYVEELPEASHFLRYQLYYRTQLTERIQTPKAFLSSIEFNLFLDILRKRLEHVYADQILVKNEYQYASKPMSYSIQLSGQPQNSKEVLAGITNALQVLKVYGVYPEEYKEVVEQYVTQGLPRAHNFWIQQLERHFLQGHPLFASPKALETQLKNISLSTFNEHLKEFVQTQPQDIGVITGNKLPSYYKNEDWVRKQLSEVSKNQLQPYVLPVVTKELIPAAIKNELKPVSFIEVEPPVQNSQAFVLENGVKIILKPFQPTPGIGAKDLYVQGFRPQGASAFSMADYASAVVAPRWIQETDLRDYTSKALNSFKETYDIHLSEPFIDYRETGMAARAPLASTEAVLEWIYTLFQAVPYSAKKVKAREILYEEREPYVPSSEEEIKSYIREFYGDMVIPRFYGYRNVNSWQNAKFLRQHQAEKSIEIYNRLFNDASQWTFILSGDFNAEEMMPLLQRYLGNLPEESVLTTSRLKASFPKPPLKGPLVQRIKTQKSMSNEKYYLQYIQPTKEVLSWQEEVLVQTLGELIETKLQRLRQELGLSVYDLWSDGYYDLEENRVQIKIEISGIPKEIEVIRKECQQIMEELKKGDVSEKYLEAAVERIKLKYTEAYLQTHEKMQQRLYDVLGNKRPWVPSQEYLSYLNGLDPKAIQRAARTYLKKENQFEFIAGNVSP